MKICKVSQNLRKEIQKRIEILGMDFIEEDFMKKNVKSSTQFIFRCNWKPGDILGFVIIDENFKSLDHFEQLIEDCHKNHKCIFKR